jgi:hypothetical protein
MSSKKNLPTIRSSAAEYLTFVAASGQGGVEAVYADEDVWLSQKMMGELYGVNVRTVSEHLKNIFADNELEQDAVIRNFRITAADGKNYNTQHPTLQPIGHHCRGQQRDESDFDKAIKAQLTHDTKGQRGE